MKSPTNDIAGTVLRALALLAACALLTTLAAPPAGAADGNPTLRQSIKVYSDLVTLGDIFDDAGSAADAPVFRSPDLGTQGVVAAKRIVAAAQQHGLFWTIPEGVEQITVERPSRVVTLDQITAVIAKRAARDLNIEDANDLSINLERRARSFHVDPRVSGALVVKRLYTRQASGRFEATVGFEGSPVPVRNRAYSGRLQETMAVAVPARAISRGTTITKDDVKTARLPRTQLPAGIAMRVEEIIGMAAKRQLAAQQPVRLTDIEEPKLVRRNTLVTIVYEVPGLTLKAQGRAQDDAAHGTAVTVLNTRSKRTVQAEVRGPGLVVVRPGRNPALGLAAAAQNRAAVAGPHVVR